MGVLSVPDDLLRRLETVARERDVSVENQAEELLSLGLLALREGAGADRERASEEERSVRMRRLQAIRDMTPKGVEQTDSVILLREDRDR